MSEVSAYIKKKKKNSQLKLAINETLWVGLKKDECWHWKSDVALCYNGWHAGYPTESGGLFERRITITDIAACNVQKSFCLPLLWQICITIDLWCLLK
jgi:hypothetical protein